MTYRELYDEIQALDQHMQPGGETAMWGDFYRDIPADDDRLDDDRLDDEAPAGTVDYWRRAYALVELQPDNAS